jgi:hypothetical protein
MRAENDALNLIHLHLEKKDTPLTYQNKNKKINKTKQNNKKKKKKRKTLNLEKMHNAKSFFFLFFLRKKKRPKIDVDHYTLVIESVAEPRGVLGGHIPKIFP